MPGFKIKRIFGRNLRPSFAPMLSTRVRAVGEHKLINMKMSLKILVQPPAHGRGRFLDCGDVSKRVRVRERERTMVLKW